MWSDVVWSAIEEDQPATGSAYLRESWVKPFVQKMVVDFPEIPSTFIFCSIKEHALRCEIR